MYHVAWAVTVRRYITAVTVCTWSVAHAAGVALSRLAGQARSLALTCNAWQHFDVRHGRSSFKVPCSSFLTILDADSKLESHYTKLVCKDTQPTC